MTTSTRRLSREALEARLRQMGIEQGRAIYVAYGSVRRAVAALRVLALGHGVSDDAVAHATRQVRLGAQHVRRLPTPRGVSW
jgi:hypothetical protein